jgi:hypothetical protein
MRGRLGLVLGVGAASALVLVVSLVSVSVAGPNVTRLAVIEHATTDTVVDLTTKGDSTANSSRSTTSCSTARTRSWWGRIRASAFGSRWA